MSDAFGQALRDFHHDDLAGPLLQRDGEETLEHPIEEFYFTDVSLEEGEGAWLDEYVEGPLLDAGAGVGRIALAFQEQTETVAIEVSDALVETMADRGVADPRTGDLFALPEQFGADRFGTLLAIGTQACLTGSMTGLTHLLADLAVVTEPGGTAVIDGHDPTDPATEELLGYREDAADGLAHRVMYFEYDGLVDPILYFRLFSPDRVREAASETPWTVDEVAAADDSPYYRIALTKE